jgi:predicted DNA-binding protein
MAEGPKFKRLNINLPEDTYDELARIAKQSGRTMTEVIRTGFGLAKIALEEEKKGHKLAIADKKGKAIREIVVAR